MTNGENTNHKNYKWVLQIVIPMATLILTPIATSIVVSFQLSKQHEYWQKEQRLLLVEQEFQVKMKLFSDVVGQINHLNNLILSFQIYSESRDTAQSLTRILKKLKYSEVDHYWKEFQGFKEKARTAYLDFLEVKANMFQTQSSCIILYGKEIAPLFTNYKRKIESLGKPLLENSEIAAILNKSIAKDSNLERAISMVGIELDKRYDQNKAAIEEEEIFKFMSKHLFSEYKNRNGE